MTEARLRPWWRRARSWQGYAVLAVLSATLGIVLGVLLFRQGREDWWTVSIVFCGGVALSATVLAIVRRSREETASDRADHG